MVSIAPNQFKVEGTIVSKKKDKQLANFVTVTIKVQKVEHLHGPGEFLEPSAKEVAIGVIDTIAADLKEGMHIQCKIRKAPGHFFVIPDSIQIGKEK